MSGSPDSPQRRGNRIFSPANEGGGIYCGGGSPNITNCTITDNSASKGGGISCRGGSPVITNCIVSGNSANDGGGIYGWYGSTTTVTNCTITHNSAVREGGGIYCDDSSPTINNCVITGNSVETDRGGEGGGIYCDDSSPNITNCTISNNSAGGSFGRGGGILCYDSSPAITNSILWGNEALNGPEIYLGGNSNAALSYTDIQGGWEGDGNIDADPLFVSPGYWADVNDPNIIVEPNDPNAVWVEGDYHLLPDSPCIDTATDANVYTDIEGNIRPFDFPGVDNNEDLPEFDMGAYEATIQAEADLMILPRTINRNSRMKRIMTLVRLPADVTEDQIDSDQPLLLYPGGIEPAHQYVVRHGKKDTPRTNIFAFFDKAELVDAVSNNGTVQLQLFGLLTTGRYFYGSDTIRIIDRRRQPQHSR